MKHLLLINILIFSLLASCGGDLSEDSSSIQSAGIAPEAAKNQEGSLAEPSKATGNSSRGMPQIYYTPDMDIDPDLQDFYDEFMDIAKQRNAKFSDFQVRVVKFWDVDDLPKDHSPGRIGLCRPIWGESQYSIVTMFHPKHWAAGAPQDHYILLKALVFHELAHCLLERPHTKSRHSLMNDYSHKNAKYLSENWDDLVNELFDPKAERLDFSDKKHWH